MSGATFSMSDVDHGFAAMARRARKASKLTIKVGAVGPAAVSSHDEAAELTVAQVLAIHEFGLGVPERSWLRGWVDERREWIRGRLRWGAGRIAAGVDERTVLDQLGAAFAGDIQERIASGIQPPLAEATIDRKGSSVPLIDTGQSRAAITWEVT